VCRPKVLPTKDGEAYTIQRSVGDIAEINCDVLSRTSGDSLYWTKDGVVVALNLAVASIQPKGKYKVTLQDDVYRLRFKVDADDVGVYNCSCGSNFLQLKLFVAG
jgi:hypothetical protein